jgi:hypothetical protein
METAEEVINDVLQELLVQASEQAVQAVDFQTTRRYLNRMMAMSPYNLLGYTNVTNPTDLITVPDAALMGIIKNLAIFLLSSYDVQITAELNRDALTGLKEIRRIAITVKPTSFPCTLPIGSGNEQENTFNNQHFYACPDNELLTEQGGSILLESDT